MIFSASINVMEIIRDVDRRYTHFHFLKCSMKSKFNNFSTICKNRFLSCRHITGVVSRSQHLPLAIGAILFLVYLQKFQKSKIITACYAVTLLTQNTVTVWVMHQSRADKFPIIRYLDCFFLTASLSFTVGYEFLTVHHHSLDQWFTNISRRTPPPWQ